MQRRRTLLIVAVNNDMFPGTMHTEESVQETVQAVLNVMIGHYHPVVLLQKNSADCGHPFYKYVKEDVAACGETTCNNYYL